VRTRVETIFCSRTRCDDHAALPGSWVMTVTPTLRRLFPVPAGPTTVGDAYDVVRPASAGRPWMNLCMVSSLDGAVADFVQR